MLPWQELKGRGRGTSVFEESPQGKGGDIATAVLG